MRRNTGLSTFLAAAAILGATSWDVPSVLSRYVSEPHPKKKELTKYDLERIKAAELKRERKAKRNK